MLQANATILFATFALLIGVVRLIRRKSTVPRVGRAGPLGYVWTILRSVMDSDGLVEEGWSKFGGRPFILPSLTGECIVLGPENVELFRKSDDTVFNAPLRNIQLFLPEIMFGEVIMTNQYHIGPVLKTDLTRALKTLVPEMLEEIQLAVPKHLPITDSINSITVPVFGTFVHLVSRVSNRAMIGAPGCRNDTFLKKQVTVAEQTIAMAQVLNWFPSFARGAVWKLFSMIAGRKDDAIGLLSPYLQSRVEYGQQDNPSIITDLLLRYAPEEDLNDVRRLAVRVVFLNMASIHTTFVLPKALIINFHHARLIRIGENATRAHRANPREIVAAIESKNGVCNKTAVGKFHMLDSLLKEVGRFHSLFSVHSVGSSRLTLREAVVADGVVIPEGSVVALGPKPLHFNPQVYPDPHTFDPFRFSKLRTGDSFTPEVQQSFTNLSNDYIGFGVGRNACPGRFLLECSKS
ncbi:cytochrome P450 [Mycena latifolia]|nr:cytochrome P450 [Mycena latifolia]